MINNVIRKSMEIRYSGRSSDYISPSFGFGCLLNCNYCYMKRHKKDGVSIAKNTKSILNKINKHSKNIDIEKPNQVDEKYICYDISCNEDFALHTKKYHDWKIIFDFFKYHSKCKATLATKIVPDWLLNYNSNNKVRIRFSLMPQIYSDLLEPNTSSIVSRILAVDKFIESGYEVHLNFSPVIVTDNWLEEYKYLFKLCNKLITNKSKVKSEVIFLTHNEKMHHYNLIKKRKGEDLIWNPEIQETKISQFGGINIRYKRELKSLYISQFKEIYNRYLDWCKIRYIF